ncbi:uncharacterized protein N7484_008127 [Penicillium longicatenatum]|uniref:uncharacterized protein n=1 Tax=Penicillium longicatenatum TaxID=1561947 RepID=UPI002546AFE2|nr:uncharacterized protein N7484_008127 [Penicillium longicatenatum]KAJ5640265.1 hypothetical protein N7484_008127 [Penicillium longicatenatum]
MSWRQNDILKILHGPQSAERELLCKFRPFNQQFLDEAGIELPDRVPVRAASSGILLLKEKPQIPSSFEEHRKIGKEIIDRVPLSAWIQLALEIPSVHITALNREMDELSQFVFGTTYLSRISNYELELEMFIYDTLKNAVDCAIEGIYSPFELTSYDVIKGPLGGILNQPLPVKDLLRQLNYIHTYCPLSEVSLKDLIDINLDIEKPTRNIAREMVKRDYRTFQEVKSLYLNGLPIQQLLKIMKHRSQFLSFTAKSLSSDPVMREKLMNLIKSQGLLLDGGD